MSRYIKIYVCVFKIESNIKKFLYLKKLNKIKNNNKMANKNIEDFFGEKKRDKSKCKNILDFRLRLKFINIEPDFEKLCSSVQTQHSH